MYRFAILSLLLAACTEPNPDEEGVTVFEPSGNQGNQGNQGNGGGFTPGGGLFGGGSGGGGSGGTGNTGGGAATPGGRGESTPGGGEATPSGELAPLGAAHTLPATINGAVLTSANVLVQALFAASAQAFAPRFPIGWWAPDLFAATTSSSTSSGPPS